METTIYGADTKLEEKKYEDVGELIDALHTEGYVVMKVVADDQDITNFSESEINRIRPIEKLEIGVEEAEKLLIDVLEEAESYLPRLMGGIEDIVNAFSQGKKMEGYQLLEQALEGFTWFNRVIENLNNNLKFDFLNSQEKKKIKKSTDKWKEKIKDLSEAMENQDTILIADLLEYEITPILEDYLPIIKKINKQLEV